jgi:hypothetical protein
MLAMPSHGDVGSTESEVSRNPRFAVYYSSQEQPTVSKHRSESDSATALADPPRVPAVGDVVHVYSSLYLNAVSTERIPSSAPAKVVRVATPGDPQTLLDLEVPYQAIHRACLPALAATSRPIGQWALIDEAGDPVRKPVTRKPTIG